MDIPDKRLDRSGNLLIADLPESQPGPQIHVMFTGSHRGNKTGKYKRMLGRDSLSQKAIMKLLCM